MKRRSHDNAMERSDQGNVGAPQKTIVEDERRDNQSFGLASRCRLDEDRHAEIKMRVILPENDFVIISLEYAKKAYPVVPFGLEVNCSLKTKRPH
ncbi:hypothetical protein SAMN06265784_106292 [Paraburkholderia susongensis]|uniref:Uncharacterized protein n=1 Tax=Paraburkholderia susongensis TaxID=1515439 RepID=A0A1X7LLH0_9BURK|nr:hypothetical protein SAMN06265784_106292 [Paraburkholderia susongensis]